MNASKTPFLLAALPKKRVRLGIETAQLLWADHIKSMLPLESSRNILTVCMPGFWISSR